MTDADLLAPPHIAALLAPVVDRLRLAIFDASKESAGVIAREFGLEGPTMMVFGNLRNVAPDELIRVTAVQAVYAYQSPERIAQAVAGIVSLGLLEEVAGGYVRFTELGAAATDRICATSAAVVDKHWAGREARVATLAELAGRAVRAAATDGGDAFGIMTPSVEPETASDAALLAERLTGLRFHRFDAHVAAWRAAGLTAEQIKAMPPSPQRDAIEVDTNRRAATPYAALSAAERLDLLAGLAALPG